MTIYIESEEQALEDLDRALFEIETWEVSEAIKRACRLLRRLRFSRSAALAVAWSYETLIYRRLGL